MEWRKCLNAICTSGDSGGITGRANFNNVDLNRNFPDQFHNTQENRHQQPETIAVMNWVKSLPFVLSANLHGGSLVANFPYDDTAGGMSIYSKCPDDTTFHALAESYSLVEYFELQNLHVFFRTEIISKPAFQTLTNARKIFIFCN